MGRRVPHLGLHLSRVVPAPRLQKGSVHCGSVGPHRGAVRIREEGQGSGTVGQPMVQAEQQGRQWGGTHAVKPGQQPALHAQRQQRPAALGPGAWSSSMLACSVCVGERLQRTLHSLSSQARHLSGAGGEGWWRDAGMGIACAGARPGPQPCGEAR